MQILCSLKSITSAVKKLTRSLKPNLTKKHTELNHMSSQPHLPAEGHMTTSLDALFKFPELSGRITYITAMFSWEMMQYPFLACTAV